MNDNKDNINELLEQSKVLGIEVTSELKKSFISYAMAVNVSRAIPDVRDGLKPVHRRILYAMNELGNTYDKPHKKSARIVGEVLGKYHPHGDIAVYDALVRMAQPFSIREVLIDGHGNFGSIDGDSAAAMRYTEARMSAIATEMLRDIEKDTVDTYPNFDDTLSQPVVLPSKYPNILVNGSDGIAVGMATSIPPHNLGEVIDGTVAFLDNENIDIEEILEKIPAPDFPTGGEIMGISGVRQAYRTGRGTAILRAKTEIECVGKNKNEEETDEYNFNNKYRIIVTEIPYQVNKENLIKTIHEYAVKGRIEGISQVNEESDREGMRIVIDIKKGTDPQYVLNQLFKHTNMQTSVSIILLALVNGVPRTLTIKEILEEYIKHQKEIIRRRTVYDLNKAQEKAHILEGLIVALDNIDEVIAIIKKSIDNQDAIDQLTAKFVLSERQAQAILDMRLKRLTSLEVEKIKNELEELEKSIKYFQDVLSTPQMVVDIIKTELLEIKKKYGDGRRTEIKYDFEGMEDEDLIRKEDVVITVSHEGYIKRMPLDEYKIQNRGGVGVKAANTKEEDYVEQIFMCNTHDPLLFFTSKGRVYRLKAYKVPEGSRISRGKAIINLITLLEGEKLSSITPYNEDNAGYVLLATRKGKIKKTSINEYQNINRNGKIAIGLQEEDELVGVRLTTGHDEILLASSAGLVSRIDESSIRAMGRTATGVKAMNLQDEKDEIIDIAVITEGKEVFTITEKGFGKRVEIEAYRKTNRGAKGVKGGNFTEETGKVAALKLVNSTDEAIIVTDAGVVIRINLSQVSMVGRNTKGVIIKRCKDDEKITSITIIPTDEEIEKEIETRKQNVSQDAEKSGEQELEI